MSWMMTLKTGSVYIHVYVVDIKYLAPNPRPAEVASPPVDPEHRPPVRRLSRMHTAQCKTTRADCGPLDRRVELSARDRAGAGSRALESPHVSRKWTQGDSGEPARRLRVCCAASRPCRAESTKGRSMANVAFLGLGVMGFPMAGWLAKKGHFGYGLQPHAREVRQMARAARRRGRRDTGRRPARAPSRVQLRRRRSRPARDRSRRRRRARRDEARRDFVDHTTASADIAREIEAAGRARGVASSTRRSREARPAPRTASSR